jgi:3-deoxy-D-manno-octulosonic-acid transferase
MIYLPYNILFTVSLIFVAPYFLFRALFDGGFRRELMQRIGFLPDLSVKRPIWVHAASVGEVFCSIPLLKKIKEEFPYCEIVLTTMTRTGNEAAKTHVPDVDQVLFLPIDHPLFVGRVIRRIRPSLLLIAETELWPNLLRSCGKEKIPVILFNGRISKKTFRCYLLLKFFFERCLRNISLFLMQTEEDRRRIVEIGAPPEKTRVAGDLKFDQSFLTFTQEAINAMMNRLGLQGKESILVAGSTHSGEEEILLSLFKDLRKINPSLILILAPRHLNRVEEVERILTRESISWIRKTSLSNQGLPDQKTKGSPEVVLLDTMGELMGLYSLGTLVFIGGSLVPVGGHNPFEPLFFKKCVLFGPYMFNFLEVSKSLIEAGGAIQVKSREDLSLHLKRLLSNEGERMEMGEKGYQFLQRHRGATEKMFEEIRPFLSQMQNAE